MGCFRWRIAAARWKPKSLEEVTGVLSAPAVPAMGLGTSAAAPVHIPDADRLTHLGFKRKDIPSIAQSTSASLY